MNFVCISNTSKRNELTIGQSYELFKHENHPRNELIDKILG